MNAPRFDIHQHITNQIVAAIEDGAGEFKLPWHGTDAKFQHPRNVTSKTKYQGVNILTLWLISQAKGFNSGIWGTFNQWTALGATVRKGEQAAHIVIYKEITDPETDDANIRSTRLFARAMPVFAAEQVDGFKIEPLGAMGASAFGASAEIDAFITATGATIHHGDCQAYFLPSTDSIYIPSQAAFVGSETSSVEESYYSTLFHELTHFTGAKGRCDRDLTGRFGSSAYAMEELIAELGAAFLCAHFNISSSPRKDHAQYLANWLEVLKSDKRAIFAAASKASQAVEFLMREPAS